MLVVKHGKIEQPQGGPLKVASPSFSVQESRSAGIRTLHKVLRLVDTRAGFAAAAGCVLLFAFFMRAWLVGAGDLWLDEAISYYLANLSPIEIIRYCAQNVSEHPPGYYLGLHFWMQLAGPSELALRYFSVMGGMLYLALAVALVRRWFSRRMALLVGVLLCVQPLAILLSRDTRMYTWYGVAMLLVLYLFDRAVERGNLLWWLLLAFASLVAITVNYLAVFTLLALAIFSVLNWRTLGRRVLPFALILLMLFGAPLLWIATSPGPRGSIEILFNALKVPWTPARFVSLYFGWPLSQAADNGQTLSLWLLAGLRWVLAVLGIVWAVPPRRWSRTAFRWLMALLILVPPLAASSVFPVLKQRFFYPTLSIFVLAIALGIVACWRRFRPFGAVLAGVLVVALLFMDGRAAFPPLRGSGWQPFSVPLNFTLARARPGEPIVYTYPWDRYQDLYYNAGRQPVDLVPPGEAPVTVEEAEAKADQILNQGGSAWLVIYPTLLAPERVEAGFDRAGYPDQITWFPGDRGVVRYFAERPLSEHAGGVVWAGGIRLNRWFSSAGALTAGDALRFQFEWQRARVSGEIASANEAGVPALVELTLVGADGQAWATRVAAPCNGLCEVASWGNDAVTERAALYIPADTPPGRYQVRLHWLTSAGEPILAQTSDAASLQAFVPLLDAEVLAPTDPNTKEASLGRTFDVQTNDGSLTLVSLNLPDAAARPGDVVQVATQWRVAASVAALNTRLVFTRGGSAAAVVSEPLGPAWHRSDAWTVGRLVRTQQAFVVPGSLAPGDYEAAFEVGPANSAAVSLRVALGKLTVQDRERRFELPTEGEAVDVDWLEGIRLARVAAPDEGKAGSTITVTLVWQADRPTAGNWKVFLHLVDAQGTSRAQGDGYPLAGAALTPTWQPGEVIVDTHRIELPGNLPAGEYHLYIGFYDEATDARLPLAPDIDTYVWPQPIEITGG